MGHLIRLFLQQLAHQLFDTKRGCCAGINGACSPLTMNRPCRNVPPFQFRETEAGVWQLGNRIISMQYTRNKRLIKGVYPKAYRISTFSQYTGTDVLFYHHMCEHVAIWHRSVLISRIEKQTRSVSIAYFFFRFHKNIFEIELYIHSTIISSFHLVPFSSLGNTLQIAPFRYCLASFICA